MSWDIKAGIKNEITEEVKDEDTASVYGEEHMPVLSTSRMVAFMEYTALSSIHGNLPESYSSVGQKIDLTHFKPAMPGQKIRCTSLLKKAKGRELVFEIKLFHDRELIAEAMHTRMIINIEAFKRIIRKNGNN